MDLEMIQKAMDKLPGTMAGILELAVADLKKQEAAENSHINMGRWLDAYTGSTGDKICCACFAGSVLRFTFGFEAPNCESGHAGGFPIALEDDQLDNRLWHLAVSLNDARIGDFSELCKFCYGKAYRVELLESFYDWVADEGLDTELCVHGDYKLGDREPWLNAMGKVIEKLKELNL